MSNTYDSSMFAQLQQRQLYGGQVTNRPFVKEFVSQGEPSSGTIYCNASTSRACPVFGLQYASIYTKYLACADEEGFVSIVNTNSQLPVGLDDDSSPNRPVAQWTAHRNAIFDLRWANKDHWIYTASGDTSLGLWDTSYAYKIASFYGHTASVKTLAISPFASEILASGSCDGNLLVWDSRLQGTGPTRVQGSEAVRQPVLRLLEPHAQANSSTPRARSSKSLQGRNPATVTAVEFLGQGTGHVIASGSVDGLVKFWDLRYTIRPTKMVTVPGDIMASLSSSIQATNANARLLHLADTSLPQLGPRAYAVTSLALRPDASQLLVSLTGGHHLLYDVNRPEIGPVRWYGGHTVSSFYVRTAFSPDGTHFMSGSSDDKVCIWQVDDTEGTAPYTLNGHEAEVTAVAWCPTDFGQIATASDDYTIKVWNLHRTQEEEPKDEPRGWAPLSQSKLSVALASAKAKAVATRANGSVLPLVDGAEKENGTTAKAEVPACSSFLEAGSAAAETPEAAVATQRIAATTAGPSAYPPSSKIRIANALRESLTRKPQAKRTKQQTLAEALRAAHASHVLGSGEDAGPSSKRPRSAGSSEDGGGNSNSQGMAERATAANENQPMNVT